MDLIKKITGQKEKRTVRIGTVRSRSGSRYRVEDDLGRFYSCFSAGVFAVGARVRMADDKITGTGPVKQKIATFEV